MHRLAVLVSGAGSNLRAIIEYPVSVALVVADRPCVACAIARAAQIPVITIGKMPNPEALTDEVVHHLHRYRIEFVAMAGFMKILSPTLFAAFPDRVLNIHPSLLPAFKGPKAVRDALAAKATETGCTVHLAEAEVDCGRILDWREVPILPGDTEERLHRRIQVAEHRLYPRTILRYMSTFRPR